MKTRVATDRPEPVVQASRPVPVPDLQVHDAAPSPPDPPPAAVRSDDTPWARSAFWVLQLVVLALYLVRLAVIVAFDLETTSVAAEFSTLALFLVPVAYAALHYGLRGGVFTAGWVSVLAVPRFLGYVGAHQYVAAWAELLQVVLLDALAVLIGHGVSAERDARRMAEAAREAHLSAEARYRELFDSNRSPILIVDADGYVVEANAAASRAFGGEPAAGRGSPSRGGQVRLVDMIGPDAAAQVLTRLVAGPVSPHGDLPDVSVPDPVAPVPFEVDGQLVLYRPAVTPLGRPDEDRRMQVVFENVTTETRRHDLMEAYAARVVLGQEEERRHIAQELHDGPVQSLIHLCRQIDLLGSRAAGHDGAGSVPELRGLVESAVGELRAIAQGLRPSILDDLGLVASLKQLLTESAARQGFETSFGVTGRERRLPPPTELALFRITQEALSNAERHAAARRVAVGLAFDAAELRLLVTDDGRGFDSSGGRSKEAAGSFGLPGMVERARLVGGRLVVHSTPGAGTTVDVRVPTTVPG